MLARVFTLDDALAKRCELSQVGHLREANESEVLDALDPSDIRTLALRYAPRAVANLARLAEGEGRSALEAARLLLSYAYGPPALPAPPAAPTPDELPFPAWAQRPAPGARLPPVESAGAIDGPGND